ncbi:MAG: ATP-dependent Clp protease adaptor ClpS [Bacteroidetes bacterium]|nr:MAG: ATP-dependent Clp protease adaptor ClpS [Bacteroidota bacterium]
MLFATQLDEEVLVEELIDDTDLGDPAQLIVYNDDHNTFDWVIRCFIEILGHEHSQSEQLALIIHTKGKAAVKEGPKKKLKPLKDGLIDRGLSAVIEEVK